MIDYLSLDDVMNERLTLDGLQLIHPSLDESDPLTYLILANSPTLSEEERQKNLLIYKQLKILENLKVVRTIQQMGFLEVNENNPEDKTE